MMKLHQCLVMAKEDPLSLSRLRGGHVPVVFLDVGARDLLEDSCAF